MRFCQVKEVLDWVVSFHERLSEEYDRLRDDATKEKVSLLLNYLAEHQRMLVSTIEKFEIDAADELLNVWSQECPSLKLPASLEELHVTLAGKETNDIVNKAIKNWAGGHRHASIAGAVLMTFMLLGICTYGGYIPRSTVGTYS